VSIDQARNDSATAPGGFAALFGNATVDTALAPYGIFLLRVAVGLDWIVHAFLKT
jgi:putative oxidoreductase